MNELILATRNRHKLRELRQMIEPLGLTVHAIGDVAPEAPEPVEDGETFEANALIKAAAAWRLTGRPSVADDSGIVIRALGGAPGVRSARWAGDACDDEANNAKMLRELRGASDRRAHYHCALVLVCSPGFLDGHTSLRTLAPNDGDAGPAVWIGFDGQLHGTITDTRAGDGGFGYDPYFLLESFGKHGQTVAELPDEAKHAISHRGVAFRALVDHLRAHLA